MFGWIARMFGNAAGVIDNVVRNWVHDLINGLYGFLHAVFDDVRSGWNWLERRSIALWHSLESLAGEIWRTLTHLYKVLIPGIVSFFLGLYNDVKKFVETVYQDLLKGIDFLTKLIGKTIQDIESWVITHIWNPIWKVLTEAWNWITHEGAIVLHYITHPADLVDLIWDALIAKLEKEAWTVADLLGKFFLSLVVKNMRQFAALIEDIINSVL